MTSKGQLASKQRIPLGEISQKAYGNEAIKDN